MSDQRPEEINDERLRTIASQLSYPPTPDLARQVGHRLREGRPPQRRRGGRLMLRAALVLLALLGSSLAVPGVRAALRELLRIGAVEIEVVTPTPGQQPTPTPATTPTPPTLESLRLSGRTTLEDAQRRLDFPVLLPSHPADIGPPDGVYVQDLDGPALVLVWSDPADPERVLMSLHTLTSEAMARKELTMSTQLQATSVGGRPAAWVSGLHILEYETVYGRSDWESRRLVEGNTLIWTIDDRTYRLESALSLEEALRVAESVR